MSMLKSKSRGDEPCDCGGRLGHTVSLLFTKILKTKSKFKSSQISNLRLSFVSSFIKKSFLFYSFQHFRKSLNSLNPSPYFLILSKSSLINNPKRLFLSSLIFHTEVIIFFFFLRTGSGFKGSKVIPFLPKTKKDCLRGYLIWLCCIYDSSPQPVY